MELEHLFNFNEFYNEYRFLLILPFFKKESVFSRSMEIEKIEKKIKLFQILTFISVFVNKRKRKASPIQFIGR